MSFKKNLFSEINFNKNKYIIYNLKKYKLSEIKEEIDKRYKKIIKIKKGIVSISSNNKIDFIINFYVCNRAGFPVYLNETESLNKIRNEKIDINYIIKKDKILKIRSPIKKIYKFNIILKTSGSTSLSRYVLLKNENISFIARNMNKEMFSNKEEYNELIFAPLNHAFGFGRLHSLIISKNNIVLTDQITFSNLLNLRRRFNMINSLSIPAKILATIIEMGSVTSKKILNGIQYIQVSTGHFPLKYRKKILNLNINLFINYGMTEAIRSTFLNCFKFKNKINTEGRPFKGIKIKIQNEKYRYGKILIKGKNLAYGYDDLEEWRKKTISGYFNSGDIGYLDNDNFLIYKFRSSGKLNINGITYYSQNIENLIKDHFKLKNVKIFSKNNSKLIYIFLNKNIKENKIYEFLNKKNINISFDKIIKHNFLYKGTGKINFAKIIEKLK